MGVSFVQVLFMLFRVHQIKLTVSRQFIDCLLYIILSSVTMATFCTLSLQHSYIFMVPLSNCVSYRCPGSPAAESYCHSFPSAALGLEKTCSPARIHNPTHRCSHTSPADLRSRLEPWCFWDAGSLEETFFGAQPHRKVAARRQQRSRPSLSQPPFNWLMLSDVVERWSPLAFGRLQLDPRLRSQPGSNQ